MLVFYRTPRVSPVQGAGLRVSAAPVALSQVYPAVLVEPPIDTCVNGVEEDVVVDSLWSFCGVCRWRVLSSMASPRA